MNVNKDFDIEMYFICVKIILPRPMGQKISGCKMTALILWVLPFVNATWDLMGESFLDQSIITQHMWAVSSSGQGLFWKNSN